MPFRPCRGDMTLRTMAFLGALLRGWQTLPQLCHETGSCERTVLRYLAAAEAAGLPLVREREVRHERARYRLLS